MFATLYDRSNACPPPPVRQRRPAPETSLSYADSLARCAQETAPAHPCPASSSRPAGVPSSGCAKGLIFCKEICSSDTWLSENRIRFKEHGRVERSKPILPTHSLVSGGATAPSDFTTTNWKAFKPPAATDYAQRRTAPAKKTSLTNSGMEKHAFETTSTAATTTSQWQSQKVSYAGRTVSHILPYHIIHGGAPLPNNHRFETFAGERVSRKRPEVGGPDV